jgi:hypothetical protein
LFTDGEPNQNPPMGIIPTLTEAMSSMKIDFSISTFGFGYQIDCDLMENIAKLGHGIYGYCPDCSMVGIIFINYLANSLTTICQHCLIEVRNTKYEKKHDVMLINGTSKNILIELSHEVIDQTKLTMTIPTTGDQIDCDRIEPVSNEGDLQAIQNQIYRYKMMTLIRDHLYHIDDAPTQVQKLFDEIKQIDNRSDYLDRLAIDLIDPHPNHGQVGKAFQTNFSGNGAKII